MTYFHTAWLKAKGDSYLSQPNGRNCACPSCTAFWKMIDAGPRIGRGL